MEPVSVRGFEGSQLITLHALTHSTLVLCILLNEKSQGKYFYAVFPCLVIVSQSLVADHCCVWCFRVNGEDYRSDPEISGVFEFHVRDGLIAPGLHCTMVDLLAAQFPAS